MLAATENVLFPRWLSGDNQSVGPLVHYDREIGYLQLWLAWWLPDE